MHFYLCMSISVFIFVHCSQPKRKTMSVRDQIQNLVSKSKIDEAIALLPSNNETILLEGRWNRFKREENLGMLSFSEASQQRARIMQAVLSYAGCDSDAMPTQRPSRPEQSSNSWEVELLQIIKDNERKNPVATKKAITLLESFRGYFDTKRTRAFYDRSGEKLQEIQKQFEEFKSNLNKSESESVDKFIDRVANILSAAIPAWPSIKQAFILCLGRAGGDSSALGRMQIEQLEKIIENQPNDDDAKLRVVQAIETFLGTL